MTVAEKQAVLAHKQIAMMFTNPSQQFLRMIANQSQQLDADLLEDAIANVKGLPELQAAITNLTTALTNVVLPTFG